jgi:hypothetical protein
MVRASPQPGKIFGALIEEVRFAADSLLEGNGFELSVPRARDPGFDQLCSGRDQLLGWGPQWHESPVYRRVCGTFQRSTTQGRAVRPCRDHKPRDAPYDDATLRGLGIDAERRQLSHTAERLRADRVENAYNTVAHSGGSVENRCAGDAHTITFQIGVNRIEAILVVREELRSRWGGWRRGGEVSNRFCRKRRRRNQFSCDIGFPFGGICAMGWRVISVGGTRWRDHETIVRRIC